MKCPGCGVAAIFSKVDSVGWYDHEPDCIYNRAMSPHSEWIEAQELVGGAARPYNRPCDCGSGLMVRLCNVCVAKAESRAYAAGEAAGRERAQEIVIETLRRREDFSARNRLILALDKSVPAALPPEPAP